MNEICKVCDIQFFVQNRVPTNLEETILIGWKGTQSSGMSSKAKLTFELKGYKQILHNTEL